MARANISLEAFYAARLVGHMFSLSFVYMYLYFLFISYLVLRAGFGYRFLQILFRKRLLTDVCQQQKVGQFAADRRLSLAKSRKICY